jgi:tetratricopeptide (TPR) repeat protein
VDKSLVVAEERAAATRYRMLETVQQYAAQQLQELGNEAHWHERHNAYFLALAEEAEPQLTGQDQQAWLERLETEHDNMRSALARSTATGGDGEAGLRLMSAISRFWLVRGYLEEGRGWLSRLLATTPGAQTTTRAKALNWAGILAWKQGDYPAAHALYEQSLTMRRELGDRRGVGAVLNNQGLLAYEQGDYAAARVLHEESLAIDRELGDRWGVAISLVHLGGLAMMQGDYPSARAMNEESLAIFRELGDRGHIANALRNLGSLCSQEGDLPAARALYDESLVICRELGDRSGIAWARNGLGVTARHDEDYSAARELFEESLAIFRELGDREGIANALNNLGLVAAARGDFAAARALQEESLTIYCALGDRSGIATSMEGLAGIAFASDEPGRAACMWGAMERLREEIGAPLVPSERHHYDRTVAAAGAALDDVATFDFAWQKGRAMMLEQAIAYALKNNDA